MTSLVLVWTAVTWWLCWTSANAPQVCSLTQPQTQTRGPGSAQAPSSRPQQQQQQQQQKKVIYAEFHSNQTLICECHLDACEMVLWFRSLEAGGPPQFLVSVNSANRRTYDPSGDQDPKRFVAKKKNIRTWSLQITAVTQGDAGVYSCVLKAKDLEGVWEPGVLLLPGVSPPTPPPKPTPEKPICSCLKNSHKPQPKGCSSGVMWPLVGILAGMATALLSTLYYFSRLPKKCRHHLVKKRQMK